MNIKTKLNKSDTDLDGWSYQHFFSEYGMFIEIYYFDSKRDQAEGIEIVTNGYDTIYNNLSELC